MSAAFTGFLANYVGKRVLDGAINNFQKGALRRRGIRLHKDAADIADAALKRLADEAINWTAQMEYKPADESLALHSTYIELDCFIEPISKRAANLNRRVRIRQVLRTLDGPLILLGRPGFGKTTTLKAICGDLIRGKSAILDAFPIPIILRLRETDGSRSLCDLILSLLHIGFENKNGEDIRLSDVDENIKTTLTTILLNEKRFVLAIDGFDEIPDGVVESAGRKFTLKEQFLVEFRQLCRASPQAYIFRVF